MSTILRISLILFLTALLPSFGHIAPTYKTCGIALNKRLTRVCSKSDSHSNISRSLNDYEQISVNLSNFVSENRSTNQMSRELFADCCTKTRGCSDEWIRQHYCNQRGISKRDEFLWNEDKLPKQWRYDCFQTDTFYYNWWHTNVTEVVGFRTAKDPMDCQQYCEEQVGCYFFSYTEIDRELAGAHSCWLRASSGGGAMRWIYATSGPWDCDIQADLMLKSPIDTCIEFANQNTQYLHKPKDYKKPSMLTFVPRFQEPNQFNMLTIKLKVYKKFTLYIGPKVSEDLSASALAADADPNKIFKNAFVMDTRFYDWNPHALVNYMTDGKWDTEQRFPQSHDDFYSGTLDEIQIWVFPNYIETYIRMVFPNSDFAITSAQLRKPAWFDTVETIWFTGDGSTKIFNLFHCTSGLTVPLGSAYLGHYNLDLPNMSVQNMLVNYVVFYGIAYGTQNGDFQIEFLASGPPNYDTAFTFSVDFAQSSEHIVYRNKVNGSYADPIEFDDFPFDTSPFGNNNFTRLEFMFLHDRINVAVNGFKYHSFEYRSYKQQDITAVRSARIDPNDKSSEIQFVIMGVDAKWIDIKE